MPHREQRAERQHHRLGATKRVPQDRCVLAAHQREGHLELASGDPVRPARQRVLIEAEEMERRGLRIGAGELVLGEVEGLARLPGLVDDAHRRVDVGEHHVPRARRIQRGDEQAVIAASVHARDGGARVGSGAVRVQPLLLRARDVALDGDGRPGARRSDGASPARVGSRQSSTAARRPARARRPLASLPAAERCPSRARRSEPPGAPASRALHRSRGREPRRRAGTG